MYHVHVQVPYHGIELLRSARHVSGHSRLTSSPYPAIDSTHLHTQLRLLIVQQQSHEQAHITKRAPAHAQQQADAVEKDAAVRERSSAETDAHMSPSTATPHHIRHSVPIRTWSFLRAPLAPTPASYHLVFQHYTDVDDVMARVGTHMSHIVSVLYGVVEEGRDTKGEDT